jgi:hypothetical protein
VEKDLHPCYTGGIVKIEETICIFEKIILEHRIAANRLNLE